MPSHLLLPATIFGQTRGQGWEQVFELFVALALSSCIGLEREVRQKSAGLRTHALVGLGAALFMQVSKYGFSDVLSTGRVVLDPSRVAAQIVSGIGFIGAGLIFVRRDSVRGLTTAAVVWLTAAVGAACGAGLLVLAGAVTVGHFIVVLGMAEVSHRLPRSKLALSFVRLRYRDGQGLLRTILHQATESGFVVASLGTSRPDGQSALVELLLEVQGRGSVQDLAASLGEIDGVMAVSAGDTNDVQD